MKYRSEEITAPYARNGRLGRPHARYEIIRGSMEFKLLNESRERSAATLCTVAVTAISILALGADIYNARSSNVNRANNVVSY